ncbi:MAG: TlpA family protein disulfide reductase [Tsuneonella sp.]
MEFASVFFRLSLTLALSALLLAGCDRGEPAAPQATASSSQGLEGKIDRSHAGELMPAMTVKDAGGKQLNLAALQGQPVLLNLWATWCAPCVKEMPLLDDLAGDYTGKLRVVTVSQDLQGDTEVPPFFAKEKFAHLEPWLDKDTALSMKLGGGNLPTTVIYSASGEEVARVVGGFDWSSPAARAVVDEALSG